MRTYTVRIEYTLSVEVKWTATLGCEVDIPELNLEDQDEEFPYGTEYFDFSGEATFKIKAEDEEEAENLALAEFQKIVDKVEKETGWYITAKLEDIDLEDIDASFEVTNIEVE